MPGFYTKVMRVPLFPLRTVLYPGGPLPLRIFEPRYIDMVSKCIGNDSPFGVLLIKSGTETGQAATYDVGTLARIIDWYQGSDGLLGITAIGEQRFRLKSSTREPDGLAVGDVEIFPTESHLMLPDEYRPLADILSGVLDDLGRLYETLEKKYDDAGWVGYRFAEILPISPEQKQSCLEADDPVQRLEMMRDVLDTVRGPESAL
jgi:Lon protease-like protein